MFASPSIISITTRHSICWLNISCPGQQAHAANSFPGYVALLDSKTPNLTNIEAV